ncbi:MAG: hypothetical protein LUF04_00575 [Bacteroides sp.]|nr:hypothetical protein [Bacteroides sp.]
MEEEIRQIARRLSMYYALLWIVPLIGMVFFETDILPAGVWADNGSAIYVAETVGILLAMVCIPLSLRLFNRVLVKKIDLLPLADAMQLYKRWAGIRLLLLGVTVCVNLLIYYMTLNSTGGLAALIALTASLFCLPGEKKVRSDLHVTTEEV